MLAKLTGKDDPLLRESAFKALRYLPPEAPNDLLRTGLEAPELSVRLASFESLLLRGDTANGDEALEQARGEYRRYLDQQADLPAGRTLRARYFRLSGEPAAAETDLELALRKDPGYLPAIVELTALLRDQRRFDETIRLLNRALKNLPNNATLHHLRGLTYLQQKEYPPALVDLARATELEPDNADFGYRYAVALYSTGDIQAAAMEAKRLLRRLPADPRIGRLFELPGLAR
ncbi:tetratricopeptide repeat protein [Marinobacterium aestuariivivens]|uniref:Tetratricopeptide repeat protein n=1 Tax=Marinobacterium aestuariivivens TaxID=1698799 RepID=A0ABW2A8Y7_9GAMM